MLTDEQRSTLADLADVLLPAYRSLPTASAVDVHRKWIDRALGVRTELQPMFAALLDRARDRDPGTELRRLKNEEQEAFSLLVTLVTWAYYAHPKVRRQLGYRGQRATPFAPGDADFYLRDGLLDAVTGRGSIYVPTPDGGS